MWCGKISISDYCWASSYPPISSIIEFDVCICSSSVSLSYIPSIFLWWISTWGGRPSIIHSCIRASIGVILFSGSHSRHLLIKSWKESLWQRSISSNGLLEGTLKLLWESFDKNGSFVWSSKKTFLREAWERMLEDGNPITSMIKESYSYSLSPGKRGTPVNNSVRMHPKLHMSIAAVYGIPIIISGAL